MMSYGYLHYEPNKISVSVDEELVRYYRSLIPRYARIQKQFYPAHISVLRNEDIKRPELWEAYEGEAIAFSYDNVVYNNSMYYWLAVVSPRLESIRTELGLPPTSDITLFPNRKHSFHITLANMKHHMTDEEKIDYFSS